MMIKLIFMKKNIFYLLIVLIVINSCKKIVTTPMPNLPWHFILNDSSINKTYSFDAQTYGYGNIYYGAYPYFDCQGGSDSLHRFDVSAHATAILTKTTSVSISIGIGSITDTAMSKRLAKGVSLTIKRNALQEVFTTGKVFGLLDFPKPHVFFGCYYFAEDGMGYTNNYLNNFAADFVKVTSSTIWNDGSGIAKIKVSLQYDTHVQGYTHIGTWLPVIKHISGSMQTFFTVQ